MEDEVVQVVCGCSTVALESLLAENNALLAQVSVNQLFVIGVASAGLVLFLLYKFLRKFY